MRRSILFALSLALLVIACVEPGNAPRSGSTGGEEEEESLEPRARALRPSLDRIGELTPGQYLFSGQPLGAERSFVVATLLESDAEAFLVRIEEGPEQRVSRARVWPVACLRRPTEVREGALRLSLAVGAPVLVLASSASSARIALGLSTEHSTIIDRDAIDLEGCVRFANVEGAEARVAAPSGGRACLFAEPDPLDGGAGLAVPPTSALWVEESLPEWSRVRVAVRGGSVSGWLPAELIESGPADPTVDWVPSALGRGACVFPGRVAPRESVAALPPVDRPVGIPAVDIERVMRAGEPQIRACYDVRRASVPELALTLEIWVAVDSDGQVSEVRIREGQDVDAELTRCAIERARRWRFPATGTGGGFSLSRRYQLRPPAEPPPE